jgi:hypothetical protein
MWIWPVAGLIALAAPEVEGPTLSLSRAGLTAQATAGSMCRQPPPGEAGPGLCVDAAYPLAVRGRLPVRPRGRVVLETSVDASKLHARLMRVRGRAVERVGGRLEVRRLSGRRWAVTLPGQLGDADVLDVFLRWENPRDGHGDASFWGGIRRACR